MKKLIGLALGTLVAFAAVGVSSSASAQEDQAPCAQETTYAAPIAPVMYRGRGSRQFERRMDRDLDRRMDRRMDRRLNVERAPFRRFERPRYGNFRREGGPQFRGGHR